MGNRLNRIYAKLHARNRANAVGIAKDKGII